MGSPETNFFNTQEVWDKAISDFDNSFKRIEEKGGEALKRFFDERDVFRQKMMSKHSDFREYALFSKLSGGTPGSICVKIDFLGDDSVLKFMLDFEKEISKE